MRKRLYAITALLVTFSMLFTACAKQIPTATPTATAPATSPAPSGTPTPGATPTPTQSQSGAPQYGGVLKFGSGSVSTSFIPLLATISNNARFLKAAFDTYLKLDASGKVQPNLATDWKFSSDFKSLTLTLRKGIKFHDGTDFNATAVKWNIEQRQAAKVGDYQELTSIDVVDDYTVRLNLAKFNNTLETTLWFIGGMALSPTAYQKYGKDQAPFNPVGTGPFKFVSYQMNVMAKYERFDGYWQAGKPYLDGYEIRYITDATTRSLAFQNGEIDVADLLVPKDADALTKKGFASLPSEINAYSILVPDSINADSPFANPKVRQALEYAIDRDAIASALGYGTYEAQHQLSHAANFSFVPELKNNRAYSPDRAKQLLTEGGYPNGFKTTIILRSPVDPSNPFIPVVTQLKAVGIDATIQAIDLAALNQTQQGGWKNGLVNRSLRVAPDWLAMVNLATSNTTIDDKSLARPAGLQDLLDKALVAPDAATKKTLSQQIVQKLADDATMLPFIASREAVSYQKSVRNLEWYGVWGPNSLWGLADTWLSK